ncbi:hypothetical protein RF55_11019 [Lasius niger]|uniref:CCHC-type domain-containing protein n=1 Tax=Lasius niger TaxID=67767 RepID=A0A0J7KG04_LASNI|nr:hypothetical protein RF55_11019 [Lasius niger]
MANGLRFSFPKLNGSNWQTWKQLMQMLLEREDLWDILTKPKPEEGDPAYNDWKKIDRKARSTIELFLEVSQLPLIKKATTARDTSAFKGYHEKATVSKRVLLLKRMCRMELGESDNLDKHLMEIEDFFDQLGDAGQDLDEPFKVAMILASLPDSYESLIQALKSRPEDDLTLDFVNSKLLDQHSKRVAKSVGSDTEKAMKSKAKSGKTKKTCFFCKKPGHFRKDCWKFLAKENEGSSSKKKHDNKDTKTKAKHVQDSNEALCFLVGGINGDWIIDNGATCYMTNDKHFFSSFTESTSDVSLADGKRIKVSGFGEGTLLGVNDNGKPVKITLKDVLYIPEFEGGFLSVSQMAEKGFSVNFGKIGCRIQNATGNVIAVGEKIGNLY